MIGSLISNDRLQLISGLINSVLIINCVQFSDRPSGRVVKERGLLSVDFRSSKFFRRILCSTSSGHHLAQRHFSPSTLFLSFFKPITMFHFAREKGIPFEDLNCRIEIAFQQSAFF